MEIKALITIGGLLSLIVGSTLAVETRYAHEADVEQIAMRLDDKIRRDRCFAIQQRIWALQDRYGLNCGPEKDTCRALRQQMIELRCGS
jgi:hypothetical protein